MAALNLNTPLLKAIAGIDNFDSDRVMMIARAAEAAGVPALDVACNPELVAAVRKVYSGTLFVSGLDPITLNACVQSGADVIELGNFDALYAQGIFVEAAEVLSLSQQLAQSISLPLSITIPGHLSLEAQCDLVEQLVRLQNVALVQTEGALRQLGQEVKTATLSSTEKAAISLRNTTALVNASRIPVMAASGFNATNLSDAISAGALAIGVGSAFNRLDTEAEMTEALTQMMTVMATLRVKPQALAS